MLESQHKNNISIMKKRLIFSLFFFGFYLGASAQSTSTLQNISPSTSASIEMNSESTFKWEGPGDSKYPFVQYLICFTYENTNLYGCLNTDQKKEKIMTPEDWAFINEELRGVNEKTVNLNWHIQSRFSDGTANGQQLLESEPTLIKVERNLSADVKPVDPSSNLPIVNQKVEITNSTNGSNFIKLEVNNIELENQFLFSVCEPKDDLDNFEKSRYIEHNDISYTNSTIELINGPLESNVDYRCYAAISTPQILTSEQKSKMITEGFLEEAINKIQTENGTEYYTGSSISDHSEFIFASTKQENTSEDKIKFQLKKATLADKIETGIHLFENPFPDTDNLKVQGKAAAELFRREVIKGFPDGDFKGQEAVNRAEAAKFLLLARYEEIDEIEYRNQFPDIPNNKWYTKFILNAADQNIINGYPDGFFRPSNTVKTAEFLKMLSITFSLPLNLEHNYSDVDEDDWFSKYAGIAKRYNLFPERENQLLPSKELSRYETAIAIYQYLSNRN